ncbi:hypothetical protein ACJRO7_025620 [Eucalyptus globulus]|uniref:Uncharacterized protein n=1 Tax=Eucalyptus globulus TaxID=34317 RepID=A0ABD3KCF5_EUCGL
MVLELHGSRESYDSRSTFQRWAERASVTEDMARRANIEGCCPGTGMEYLYDFRQASYYVPILPNHFITINSDKESIKTHLDYSSKAWCLAVEPLLRKLGLRMRTCHRIQQLITS